jgi:hypothetical protein
MWGVGNSNSYMAEESQNSVPGVTSWLKCLYVKVAEKKQLAYFFRRCLEVARQPGMQILVQ